MNITATANAISQLLLTLLQFLNLDTTITEGNVKVIVAGVIALIQGVIAIVGHYSNPDATPVTTAYVPKKSLQGKG